MRVFVTGASGFVGNAVTEALLARGDAVVALSRSGKGPKGAEIVTGDVGRPGGWQARLAECDATVHLAGESLSASRWNDDLKRRIRESRVEGTRNVVSAGPRILVSASGADYYRFDDSDTPYAEDGATGDHFLAEICRVWEAEAMKAAGKGARVVTPRIGLVLGRGGGAMGKLVPIFRRFAGGPLGTGTQWVSWIHLDDLCGVILRALDDATMSGPLNAVTASVRQAELARALGDALKRPSWLQVPAFALKLAVGEMAQMLLNGRNVVPAALAKAGYAFKFPTLAKAVAAIV